MYILELKIHTRVLQNTAGLQNPSKVIVLSAKQRTSGKSSFKTTNKKNNKKLMNTGWHVKK